MSVWIAKMSLMIYDYTCVNQFGKRTFYMSQYVEYEKVELKVKYTNF